MSSVLILRGIPASGKSSFALAWVAEDPENRVRVNRDDIRFMTFGKYWGVDENYVTKVQNDLLVAAFKAGRDVVLDNTNLKTAHVRGILKLAAQWGAEVKHRDFPIELQVAVERDARRALGGGRGVGEDVIQSFYQRYIRNGKFPPFPETLRDPVVFPKYEPNHSKPWAILVDIDGTLAIHNGRSPYDDSLIHTDLVDEVVRDLVNRHKHDHKIIVMSGRDKGKAAVATVTWLTQHHIHYDRLFMRPAGDTRNDAIVKNELFEEYVAPNWHVRFALDDRSRVVEMWRSKGIKTLQVEPGDF